MPDKRKYSFSIKEISLLLVLSLPIDLVFFESHGGSLNPPFSKISICLLVSATILSFSNIQYAILALLIRLQRLTLTSKDSRVALIAGALLLLFGIAEASSFIANQNLLSILVSIWIVIAALISTRKELQNYKSALNDTKQRAALLLRRTVQQDLLLHCLPLVLLRASSFSLIFDASHNQSHVVVSWLIVLGTAALILLYTPNESERISHCPDCRTPSLRALIMLSNCHSCEAARARAIPAKAAPRAKKASSLAQNIPEIERPLGAVLAGAADAHRKFQALLVMGAKRLSR